MTVKGAVRESMKPITFRLIVPKVVLQRVLTGLGPTAKVQADELDLKTERLSTEDVVRYIKEYTKLRDELVQTFRQLIIERNGKPLLPKLSDLDSILQEARTKIGEVQSEYKLITTETEGLERQAQEAAKQISTVEQLAATGFSYDEMASQMTGFRRILGRLPSKKLDAAQKALRALLKDRTVVTTGARRNDWAYLLVASPTDVASPALQTLLLYDFIATDMPAFDGPDLKEALKSWEEKRERLYRDVETGRNKMSTFRGELAEPLNSLADHIQEALLLLRSSLRLGESTKIAHIFVRLEKPPPAEVLNALVKDGILELD